MIKFLHCTDCCGGFLDVFLRHIHIAKPTIQALITNKLLTAIRITHGISPANKSVSGPGFFFIEIFIFLFV